MSATQEIALRDEIAKLGEMLGETIREIAGNEAVGREGTHRRDANNRIGRRGNE